MTRVAITCCYISLLVSGCSKSPPAVHQPLPVKPAASVVPQDVEMVVFQAAHAGHEPMSMSVPMRGRPYSITREQDIKAIMEAVTYPDDKAQTRMARNDRLAIIKEDGRVELYGLGGVVGGGCDITFHDHSFTIVKALSTARGRSKIDSLQISSQVSSIAYDKKAGRIPEQKILSQLLGLYSPLALKGNSRCSIDEIQAIIDKSLHTIEIKLKERDTISAIVMKAEEDWPPMRYASSFRLEKVRFDTIVVCRLNEAQVQFVFLDNTDKQAMYSDPVFSFELPKQVDRQTPPVLGPDFYKKAVSAITR